MELKPGYKQTEVGVIPEDWDVSLVRDLVRDGPKNGYSGPSGDAASGTPTLSLAATSSGRLVLNDATVKYLNQHIPAGSPLFLERFDVLVQRSNTRELVGTTAVFDGPAATYVYPDLMMRLRFKQRASIEWFWRYANGDSGRAFFRRAAAGSTGSMPKISGESLGAMPVPLPPPEESDKITRALNDADALIESLEQLLAKKRQLKQGAMQELLTGKKRLPGFNGEWDVMTIGACFTLVNARNTELNDNVVTISAQSGFVRQEEFFKKRVASKVLENYYLIERGDFAYNRSYSNGYPFGAIKRLTKYEKGVVTTLYICFALKPEAESDPAFFEHYFEAGLLNPALATVTNEGGRAHGLLNITKADFLACELRRPPLAEQAAIAAILSDMDAGIAALEKKLAKARAIKQGMMQELLTGRIRLV